MADSLEELVKKKDFPGEFSFIGKIPTALTIDHHHNFPYWYFSGIKNAILIHIDSHSDMSDEKVPYSELDKKTNKLPFDYYKRLHIDNFICPAVYYGIIKESFWINPFNKNSFINKYIEYAGQRYNSKKNLKMSAQIKRKEIIWGNKEKFNFNGGYGLSIKQKKIDLSDNPSCILDIDLDAFAVINYTSLQTYYSYGRKYHCINGWERRIESTINLLKERFPKPELITITRSTGDEPYTSILIVNSVEEKLIKDIKELYA